MINVNNMERDIAIARINYCHFHYFFSNNRKLILVIYRKSVLIDTFVLDKIIRIMTEMVISP
jgi:hypothetical protein